MTQGKKIVAAFLAATVIVTLTIMLTSVALVYRDRSTLPSGLYVDGKTIGGQSRSQVEQMLAAGPGAHSQKWSLRFPDKLLTLPTTEYGIKLDKKATLQKIDSILTEKKGLSGIINHSVFRGKKHNIAVAYQCNRDVLYNGLNKQEEKINRLAVNARIIYNKGLLEYIPQQNGYLLDLDATVTRICTALQEGHTTVDAAIIPLYPAVKIEDIRSVKDIIGAYAAAGLSEAVVQQTQQLNGTIIMPGQILTFPAKEENPPPGMEKAMNAIIRACEEAGLKIVSPASAPKLVIQNNLTDPVLISIIMCDGTMQIKALGCQTEPGKKIHLTTEEQEVPPQVKLKTDKSLQPHERVIKQQGKPGTVVRTYRLVTVKGKVVEKTLLAQEMHPGIDTIIYEGAHALIK
ncbi:MAG TPA: hypothetical protein DER33_11000 [Syntrophomonas sp.]|jgi:hypothetical protein|nr:hypothetical protein [Syntrophomonas sp.]